MLLIMFFDGLGLMARASSQVPEVIASGPNHQRTLSVALVSKSQDLFPRVFLGTWIQVLLIMFFDGLGLMARASSRVTASSPRGVQEKFI